MTDNPNDQIKRHLGETLEDILNFDTWQEGEDLETLYNRLERELTEATSQEERVRGEIFARVLPLLKTRRRAPKGAGLYQVGLDQIKWAHHHLLLNGAVVAADGTVLVHDSLLMSIGQIGVCTVSYDGHNSSFNKHLFRRDVRLEIGDLVEQTMALLEERQQRSALGYSDNLDELSQLMQRGLMEYGERGQLLKVAGSRWMMGHGSPVPKNMLVGTSTLPLVEASLPLLQKLILEQQKFVYIPSSPRELLVLTLGNVLEAGQFLIIDTLYDQLEGWIGQARYAQRLGKRVRDFVEEVGPQVVRGVFRASQSSPAYVFYAHQDRAQEAALIAIADSVLQEHRGFPMLLTLADVLCRASFEPASFAAVVEQSYAQAGQPFRYQLERRTR